MKVHKYEIGQRRRKTKIDLDLSPDLAWSTNIPSEASFDHTSL